MEQCELMFRPLTNKHFYSTTTHCLPTLVVFGLSKSLWHFSIYLFRPVSTSYHFASSVCHHFNLERFLNWFHLHIRISVTMCVGAVIPLSVGQCASTTGWYITHLILTYSLRSINVNLTTDLSTQRPFYPPNDPHIHRKTIIMALPGVQRRSPTSVSKWTNEICAPMLMKMTQDIDAVSSQSVFTEGLAAHQWWKTKHGKSTLHSYANIKL